MAWTLARYQTGGVVDEWRIARPNIVALARLIAARAGMPLLRLQFTPGAYAHLSGLAVDMQPGGGLGNPEGMRALRGVILALDWDHHGIRYAAGLRMEYGGSHGGVERARPQDLPYQGNDGWHDRHWHVDVLPEAPVPSSLIFAKAAPSLPTIPPAPAPPPPAPTPERTWLEMVSESQLRNIVTSTVRDQLAPIRSVLGSREAEGGVSNQAQAANRRAIEAEPIIRNLPGAVERASERARVAAERSLRALEGLQALSDEVGELKALINAVAELSGIEQPFSDVPYTHAFFREIAWAAEEGIAVGWPDGSFRPSNDVDRGSAATLLHRLAGSPEVKGKVSTFSDVTAKNSHAEGVAWAVSEGIAAGWEDGTFRPSAPVERGALLSFLYRLAGSPRVSTAPSFSDVPRSHPFRDAISWATAAGIATGWPDGTFRPAEPVSRAAAAAFLYRYAHLED